MKFLKLEFFLNKVLMIIIFAVILAAHLPEFGTPVVNCEVETPDSGVSTSSEKDLNRSEWK